MYKVSWKDNNYKITGIIPKIMKRSYKIETRNISDEEISELFNFIDEEKKLLNTNDYSIEELNHNHFDVFYNNYLVELKKLPFSY